MTLKWSLSLSGVEFRRGFILLRGQLRQNPRLVPTKRAPIWLARHEVRPLLPDRVASNLWHTSLGVGLRSSLPAQEHHDERPYHDGSRHRWHYRSCSLRSVKSSSTNIKLDNNTHTFKRLMNQSFSFFQ